MNFTRVLALLAVVCGLSMPAFAGTTIYECTVKTGTESGWITPQVIIARPDGSDTAKVADAIIQSVVGRPIDAKVKADTSAKLTFGWVVTTQDRSGNNANMTYRATILKGSNAFVLAAIPTGYANTFRGDGTCKVLHKK